MADERSKDWWLKRARAEGNVEVEIAAGTMTDTPDDLVKRLRDVGEIKDDDAYEGVDPRVVRAMRGVAEVMKQGADRIETLESERREISMSIGNQPDEPISTEALIANIEQISRIAGKAVLQVSALEARERVLLEALTTIGHSLVCAPIDYADHNASELLRAGEIARAALAGDAP